MIEAKQMERSSLEVVNVYRVFNNVISEFICFTIHRTSFDTTAGHPDGKAAWMMIAAIIIGCHRALAVIGSAEFPAPDDKRFVKQSPLLQIGDQSGRSLVYILCLPAHFIR